MTEETKADYLLLKWGVIAAWRLNSPDHVAILQRYFDLEGRSMSLMAQSNGDEHKKILCELIDALPADAEIINDWTGGNIPVQRRCQEICNGVW